MENIKTDALSIDSLEIVAEVLSLVEMSKKNNDSDITFPSDVFPKPIYEIIKDTKNAFNFPEDFIGASIIFAASVAIGNTYKIQLNSTFIESAVIYLAIVAPRGTNKSQPLKFAVEPLVEHDTRTFQNYERKLNEYKKSQALTKKDRQKSDEEISKPGWYKYLLKDYTPEALAEVHKFNKRGIGVYNDELASWFKNFNRYNKGSEAEFWISNFNGTPINIDRKSSESLYIPKPFISIAGTMQNGILYNLAQDNRVENGFIDRILFVIPDNIQKQYWNENEINQGTIQTYKKIIDNLLLMTIEYDNTNNPVPQILNFTPEAKKILLEWQVKNTDMANQTDNDAIKGIYSKLEYYVIRFSLILELLKYACGNNEVIAVTTDAVEGAIKLIEYFRASAIKVQSILLNIDPLERLPQDKKTLYNELPSSFTTEHGLQIAEKLKIPERTFKRFINEKLLFKKTSRGNYEKQF